MADVSSPPRRQVGRRPALASLAAAMLIGLAYLSWGFIGSPREEDVGEWSSATSSPSETSQVDEDITSTAFFVGGTTASLLGTVPAEAMRVERSTGSDLFTTTEAGSTTWDQWEEVLRTPQFHISRSRDISLDGDDDMGGNQLTITSSAPIGDGLICGLQVRFTFTQHSMLADDEPLSLGLLVKALQVDTAEITPTYISASRSSRPTAWIRS